MSDIEKFVLFISPLISLLGLVLGWARWKSGDQGVAQSNAANNFADAANKTAGLNERLQTKIDAHTEEKTGLQKKMDAASERLQKQMDAHVEDKRILQEKIDEASGLIAELRQERENLVREHEQWQDRNMELAKRVGVLSRNYEGLEKEVARIRKWGYANAAEVTRLGGTPIRLEDVR